MNLPTRIARRGAMALACGLAATVAAPAPAQWSADPAANLVIADRISEQVLPKIASTPDGGAWIGWFDHASGNYDVYVQRLDAQGNEQFAHNGLLVSAHPSNSSLVDWDLIADSTGHVVLVLADARGGSDLDIHAYRISPAGAFVWGPDGITLSSNSDFEPSPAVAEASDGDFVFVWARLPDASDGTLRMQRIAPDGTVELVADGLVIAAATGEDPGFTDVVPASAGDVIVSWVRDISTFSSPRHVRAQKFDDAGAAQWAGGPVNVYDAVPVPIAHLPVLQPDGAGGAILAWHASVSGLFETRVQHLEADGSERWAHNGVLVSTQANQHELDPSVSYLPATDEIIVAWDDRNPSQSQRGISAQKIDASGARAWGATGIVLVPLSSVNQFSPRSVPWADGAMIFLRDEPNGPSMGTRVLGMRLDGSGSQVWASPPLVVSSVLSSKSRLPVTISAAGTAMMVWEDDRGATVDVYVQNVSADGTLGAAAILGDLDGNGFVNVSDLLQLLAAWGPCHNCPEDLNDDDSIDILDLLILLANWT